MVLTAPLKSWIASNTMPNSKKRYNVPIETARRLQEKYGSTNNKAIVNRAIRAECPGGSECLDALEHHGAVLHGAMASRRDGEPGIERVRDVAEDAVDWLTRICEAMATSILAKYGEGSNA